jgi:integrase
MVKSLPQYLPDVPPAQLRVRKVAASSKSWTENGVDVADMILRADRIDIRFGLMLRMMLAFGLRRMEVLQLRPWKSDMETRLVIYCAKNGRPREIPIERAEQRQVLDYVKAEIRRPDPLGWSLTLQGRPATLAYNTRLYNKFMAEIGITRADAGVTGHGLRAQYAENAALMMHLIPPTLGGTGGQLPKDVITLHRQQVSENLGHSRVSVTAAYYGSFPRYAKPDDADRARSVIAGCISSLDSAALPECQPERRVDCLNLISELSVINVDVTVRQIHRIWCAASARHGRAWVTPVESGNLEEIEVAARSCDLNTGG